MGPTRSRAPTGTPGPTAVQPAARTGAPAARPVAADVVFEATDEDALDEAIAEEDHQRPDRERGDRDVHEEDGAPPEVFEQQAARGPDAIAVVYGENHLSYGELNRRANQLAHSLRQLGVGPEVPVALCLERSLEMIIALLGVLKAGGAYVPLDPDYPRDRLQFMVEDSDAPLVVTTSGALGGWMQPGGPYTATRRRSP